MYLCKFDEAGKRIATVLKGVHFKTKAEKQKYLDEGYLETSDEDYAFYVGNRGNGANGTGYVRGSDGKPTDAPAHVPSTDEKKQAIINQYEADKDALMKYYADAALHDDTELMAEYTAMQPPMKKLKALKPGITPIVSTDVCWRIAYRIRLSMLWKLRTGAPRRQRRARMGSMFSIIQMR